MKSVSIFIIVSIVLFCCIYVIMTYVSEDKTFKTISSDGQSTVISPVGVVGGVVGLK